MTRAFVVELALTEVVGVSWRVFISGILEVRLIL